MSISIYRPSCSVIPFSFNGKLFNANVSICFFLEEYPHYDFEPKEYNEMLKTNVNNGNTECIHIYVTANFEGMQGHDNLGNNFVQSERESLLVVEQYGMVANAIADLKENLTLLLREIEKGVAL